MWNNLLPSDPPLVNEALELKLEGYLETLLLLKER
jgi:hypothetical protein